MTTYGVGPTLVLMPFGSHLYGTQTESSDQDFKGVFIPTVDSALTGRIPTRDRLVPKKRDGEKNLPGDVDFELVSLHEFVRLAIEGQTIALDMLHASDSIIIEQSNEWRSLRANRSRFYTRNLSAFVGYARRQAAKYGVKGSRLECGRAWVEILERYPGVKIGDLISFGAEWPSGTWIHAKITENAAAPLDVLGKQMTAGATTDHYLPTMKKYVDTYGERARMAERSEGVDWKAMSHAVRASIEVELIFTVGDFSLPFDKQTATHLRRIKCGEFSFQEVRSELEGRIENLENLSAKSTLPDKVDEEWAWSVVRDMMAAQGVL